MYAYFERMHTLCQAYRTLKQAAARGPQPALAIHMVPELQGEMEGSMSISQSSCSLSGPSPLFLKLYLSFRHFHGLV